MKKYDIILCYVPKSDIDCPLLGLPIIKSVLNSNNYKSKIIDFNIRFYKIYKKFYNDEWVYLDKIFKKGKIEKLKDLIIEWSNELLSYNTKYIGFSALSTHNIYFIKLMSIQLKTIRPDIKIIVGGPGIKWFGQDFVNKKIIDYYIIGYGEEAILKILKNKYKNKNIPQNVIDLSRSPIPDFSDLNLNDYKNKLLFTYISRGCTQSCKFCNVDDLWGGFNYRSVESTIQEMTYLRNKFNNNRFSFCDSLLNANLPIMRKLLLELKDNNFKWEGMIRIREMLSSDYELLKSSGCYLLKIGIESGNYNLRKSMGKYFTNKQLFTVLGELYLSNLKCDLFFITGYPGETKKYFEDTIKLINEIKNKEVRRVISCIRVQPIEMFNIENEIGYKERIDRYIILRKLILDSGFKIRRDKKMLARIEI